MALRDTARLVASLELEDKFSRKADAIGRSAQGLESKFDKIGRSAGTANDRLAKTGRGLGAGALKAVAVGATAAGIGLGVAARAAIQYEDAFAGVKKTVDETDLRKSGQSFESLSKDIRQMATEMPIAATEIAGLAEDAGALGVKAADIKEFTRVTALLGVTTNVASHDAATAIGQLGNVLNLTGEDYARFGATLVDLGNKGASTEADILEITRRAGSAGKLIGLAADQTLAWSAAVANLGVNPELGGTNLQSVFLKVNAAVSEGKDTLDVLAKTTGMTADQFKKAFEQDANGALEKFIAGLSKLDKAQRQTVSKDVFGKGSGITRIILGLAESYDRNLVPAIGNANTAWKQNSALTTEAQKRFDTVASKIQVFRNNLTEAAITVGEGFAPAIGRAADKLSNFLKQDTNRAALKSLGEDIGSALDRIDWNGLINDAKSLVAVAKTGADVLLGILGTLNQLPMQIKGVGAGLIGLNSLSGGLVAGFGANVITGIGGALTRGVAAKIPGVGALTAQPVYVVNFPPGMGLPGGGGPGGGPGGIPLVIPAAIAVAGIAEGFREAAGFRGERDQLRQDVPSLTNSEALAVQLSKMTDAARTMALQHGAATEFIREGTTYAKALQTASEKLAGAAAKPTGPADAERTAAARAAGTSSGDRRSEGALARMAQALPEKVASRISELSREFISALRTARQRNDPQAAHRAATAAEGGAGNARNTARLLSTLEGLRRAASRRGDRQTVKLLDGDIRRISAISDHRRLVAQQLARADRIVRSNASTKDKVEDLKGIERNIGSRNRVALEHVRTEIARLQGGANKTANAIDRSRVHLANKIEDAGATTAEASRGTTRTIQQKSFTAQVTVPVTTVIDGRTFRSTLTRTSQSSRYGSSVT